MLLNRGNEYAMCNRDLGTPDEAMNAGILKGWLLSEPAVKLAKPWGVDPRSQEHPARR